MPPPTSSARPTATSSRRSAGEAGTGDEPTSSQGADPTPECLGARTPGRAAPGVVIFVDEIDAVRGLPFSADEFFAAIRECYTRRARDREFERISFCLL